MHLGYIDTAEISTVPLLSYFSKRLFVDFLWYIELEKNALVWSEILRLFVNTLTADNKYSRCNVHNFAQQVQTPLFQKQRIILKTKEFLWIFYCISEMCMKFRKFWKKRWVS